MGKAFAALVLFGAALIARAWVLAALWGWFVVPLGVRPIGLAWATGLAMAGTLFCGGESWDDEVKKAETDGLVTKLVGRVLGYGVVWCIGWYLAWLMT